MSGAPGKLGRALHAIRRGYGALGSVTRVIGALTAVIAFGTAVAQVYSAISDNRARRAAETSLIKLADSQLQNREYYASWNANAKAVAIAPKTPDNRQNSRKSCRLKPLSHTIRISD